MEEDLYIGAHAVDMPAEMDSFIEGSVSDIPMGELADLLIEPEDIIPDPVAHQL